jgi:uncharacterized protein (DUF2384 family)
MDTILAIIYKDKAKRRKWLYDYNGLLRDKPIDLIKKPDGIEKVHNFLLKMKNKDD